MEKQLSSSSSYYMFKRSFERITNQHEDPVNSTLNESRAEEGSEENNGHGHSGLNNTTESLTIRRASVAVEATRGKDDEAVPSQEKSLYTCRECGKSFRKLEYFRHHLMKHLMYGDEYLEHPFRCRQSKCLKRFESKKARRAHECRHLAVNSYTFDRVRKYFNDHAK